MEYTTHTVTCPGCGQSAQLRLLRSVDEQGHTLADELLFVCLCGHRPTSAQARSLWEAMDAPRI